MNNKAKHFWQELGQKDLEDYAIVQITIGEEHCLCGNKIKNLFVIEHQQTGTQKIIGKDCAKRLGFKLQWKTMSDFLLNATLMARNKNERKFTREQQDRLPKWDRYLKVSEKQKKWLEDITEHKWKWGVWNDKDFD